MNVLFELKMCNIGSWNGKWTGEGKRYIDIRKLKKDQVDQILNGKEEVSFHHSWGDGWACNVYVRLLGSGEKRQLKKHLSNGFCGYNWMVDNIIKYQSTIEKEQSSTNKT